VQRPSTWLGTNGAGVALTGNAGMVRTRTRFAPPAAAGYQSSFFTIASNAPPA
jgi:hypothetical protein